jgi:REP element-mobilizing transposase RayT
LAKRALAQNTSLIMSFIKVYVHYVWATYKRNPFLTNDVRQEVFNHILDNARKKGIYIDFINGFTDHVHCLVSLSDNLSIGEIAQLIKGESSNWINKNKLTKDKFAWQSEYFAIGVGDDKLSIVRNYIANQEEHHKKLTFSQEYDKFIKRYGLGIEREDNE